MKAKLCVLFSALFFSFGVYAINPFGLIKTAETCSPVMSDNTPQFCAQFKSAVKCQCDASIGGSFCENMNAVYNMMVATYGDVSAACNIEYQENPSWMTSPQACIDQWKCYTIGGKDSHGNNCSGRASANNYCEKL